MKYYQFILAVLFTFLVSFTQKTYAQSIPTEAQVTKFVNNNHFLVTYREGEVLYGTYYFIEIHYCSTGYYGLYGKSVKKTVLGNEQKNNWQEFGSWKVTRYNGNVGLYYKTTENQEKFFPLYLLPNGNLSLGEGTSIVLQGKAICN
jgi:hypothetical protein